MHNDLITLWLNHLQEVLYDYRYSVHSSLDYSPARLLFSRSRKMLELAKKQIKMVIKKNNAQCSLCYPYNPKLLVGDDVIV